MDQTPLRQTTLKSARSIQSSSGPSRRSHISHLSHRTEKMKQSNMLEVEKINQDSTEQSRDLIDKKKNEVTNEHGDEMTSQDF